MSAQSRHALLLARTLTGMQAEGDGARVSGGDGQFTLAVC